jgi:hypothetical protein
MYYLTYHIYTHYHNKQVYIELSVFDYILLQIRQEKFNNNKLKCTCVTVKVLYMCNSKSILLKYLRFYKY